MVRALGLRVGEQLGWDALLTDQQAGIGSVCAEQQHDAADLSLAPRQPNPLSYYFTHTVTGGPTWRTTQPCSSMPTMVLAQHTG